MVVPAPTLWPAGYIFGPLALGQRVGFVIYWVVLVQMGGVAIRSIATECPENCPLKLAACTSAYRGAVAFWARTGGVGGARAGHG